jgi:NitT/TauT family transport system permease protein
MRALIDRWLVVVLFLLAWELAPALGLADPFFTSRPSLIVARLFDWVASGMLLRNLLASCEEAGIGFAIGVVAGTAFGLLCGLLRPASRALVPLLTVGNALPKLAFAPLLIAWFGFGMSSKIVLAAGVVFFFVFFGVYSGLRNGDALVVANARMLGGSGWNMLRHVYLPSALGWIVASLRLAVAYAFAAAVVGEYLGADRGLGYAIIYGKNMLDMTEVFTGLVVITAVVGVLDVALRRAADWMLPYRGGAPAIEIRA